MLKYRVAMPLGVFAVLLLAGVPPASAARYGVAAGCVAMVLMMLPGCPHRDAVGMAVWTAPAKEAKRAA